MKKLMFIIPLFLLLIISGCQQNTPSAPQPTSTYTSTNTPVFSPTITPTSTQTDTYTASPTFTDTDTVTLTPTITPTSTDSPVVSATPTSTPTGTFTITETFTETSTPTGTLTITATSTPTFTITLTHTATATSTDLPAGADGYEPDNVYTQGTTLTSGVQQTHTLIPSGDEDWYVFTVAYTNANVIIETSPGEVDADTRMWLYDSAGVPSTEIAYNDDSMNYYSKIDIDLTPGTYYVKINEYSSGAIDSYNIDLTITEIFPVTLNEALDNGGLTFSTGGDAGWSGKTDASGSHDGTDMAKSGTIIDDEQSWLETTVNGPGTLTFWWRVSSESNFDYLEWLIDSTQQTEISGITAWAQVTAPIAAGTHTIRWRYYKDGSVSEGDDRGYVDEVTWTP